MDRRTFCSLVPVFPVATVSASLTLREEGKEPIEVSVQTLKLEPGDVLVFRSDDPISAQNATRIIDYVETQLPHRVRAMVLDGGLSLEGVLRA